MKNNIKKQHLYLKRQLTNRFMSEIEQTAIAVAETAKFGATSVESVTKMGSFLARVFGMPIENAVGIIGDKIEFTRWERQNRLIDKVIEEQTKRGLKQFRAVPPKFAIPIVFNASIEEDDELQDLWCKLLTNYSDPNFKIELRYAFIDIIKSLTSLDAKILKYVYDYVKDESERCNYTPSMIKASIIRAAVNFYYFYSVKDKFRETDTSQTREPYIFQTLKSIPIPITFDRIQNAIKSSVTETEISLYNLKRVQCIWDTDLFRLRVDVNDALKDSYNGNRQIDLTDPSLRRNDIIKNSFLVTPLGEAFVLACMK